MHEKLNRNWPYILLGTGVLVAAGATFAGMGYRPALPPLTAAIPVMTPARTPLAGGSAMEALRNLDTAFSEISESVSDAVVQIAPKTGGGGGRMQAMNGSGSGFVYRADGWIVTNDHVVGGQKEVTVITRDGREYTGTVYAANDPQIDLAVVKIEASGLETLPLGEMRKVKAGQFVLAVGSPFGLQSSVTIGHVSALNRPGQVFDPRTRGFRNYTGMIQTDAAINPGNSGGPLLNIDGEVIGVNSTINTLTGGSAGIGFAIPANTVKIVADELIATKKFDRGFLGIEFDQDLKPYQLKEMGIPGGATVATVPEDGASYKAGIRANDIILQVDNDKVLTSNDLLLTMYRRSPGDSVTVKYMRGGKENSATIKLNDMPESVRASIEGSRMDPRIERRSPESLDEIFPEIGREFRRNFEEDPTDPQEAAPEGRPRLGVTVEVIGEGQRRQFRLPKEVTGVVVTSVAEGSVAAKFGLAPGDVIKSLQGAKVASPTDLTTALGKIQWRQDVSIEFDRYASGGKITSSITKPFIP